jgi:hypothetical protein
MTTSRESKTITKAATIEAPTPEQFSQRKRQEQSQFRLQVDRQTKGSYDSFEAAQAAGIAIKKDYPKLQVAVYDSKESVNTIIEVSSA